MASPHVAGVAALMLQQDPALDQGAVESTLKGTAIPFTYRDGQDLCRDVTGPNGVTSEVCWAADASGAGLVTADAALAGLSNDSGGDTGGSDKPGKGHGRGN